MTRAWCFKLVILAFGKLRQEDCKDKAGLDNLETFSLKIIKVEKKRTEVGAQL